VVADIVRDSSGVALGNGLGVGCKIWDAVLGSIICWKISEQEDLLQNAYQKLHQRLGCRLYMN